MSETLTQQDLGRVEDLRINLGKKLFEVLTDPENTDRVEEFCREIATSTPRITLGSRNYKVIAVDKDTLLPPNLNKDEAKYAEKHGDDIPFEYYKANALFVYYDWKSTFPVMDSVHVLCLSESGYWSIFEMTYEEIARRSLDGRRYVLQRVE